MRKLCMCNKRHEELCWLVACKLLGTALPSRRDALPYSYELRVWPRCRLPVDLPDGRRRGRAPMDLGCDN